ncbi:hypothetical protein L1765_10100 [Microaerobacter geothermalis]|uniref:hypothetical protein n=1 Tax=Microaerobacter geothermalis TaxID=674972 RepID=UPI001F25DA26|nr:hypothetical protein [Microaerobacter geothermalis]MCF6094314.1 hypothetical protein [Microaerobacter geothermalis]
MLKKVIVLTLLITLITGAGLASFGVYKADAGGFSFLGKIGGIGKIFKGGWFGKVKETGNTVSEKVKKIYPYAKWGSIGLLGADIFFNDANFLGSSLGYVFERVAGFLSFIIPPPQELIYNYKTTYDAEGNQIAEFKGKDQYAFYIFPESIWEKMKVAYYFMMAIFWSALVIIIIYQANHLMFPRGVQDRITATSVLVTAVLTGLAVFFIPYLIGIYTDISMFFTALFANMVDPELARMGILGYANELQDGLTQAIVKLIALSQMGMIFFIYFMRAVAILSLFSLFPIIAALQNFPSKRHLFSMWNREMLANIFIQPVHAFMYSFGFLFLTNASDNEKIGYSIIILLAVIPAGAIVREVFGSYSMAQEGAGWLKSMFLGGLGITGMLATGKLAKHTFQGARDVYSNNLAYSQTGAQSGFGTTLRRGLNFSAGAVGALAGIGLGGMSGAKGGLMTGKGLANFATKKIDGVVSSPAVQEKVHTTLSRLPFLNQDYHRERAKVFKDFQSLPEQFVQGQKDEEQSVAKLRSLDGRLNPVFKAKQEYSQAKSRLDAAENTTEAFDRVKAQDILQKHGETYKRVRPTLLNAHSMYGDAKAKYAKSLKNYNALPQHAPEKQMAKKQLVGAYKEMQAQKQNLNQVYQDKGLQAMTKDGYRYHTPIGRYLDSDFEVKQAKFHLQEAESRYGTYEQLEQSYNDAVSDFHQIAVKQADLSQRKTEVEQIVGRKIEIPSVNRQSVPIKNYRLEPVFLPSESHSPVNQQQTQKGNRKSLVKEHSIEKSNQKIDPAWFSDPVTDKQSYTLKTMGIPSNTVKNKGEAHLYISGQKKWQG